MGAPPWSLGPDPLDPRNRPRPLKTSGLARFQHTQRVDPDSKVVRPYISPAGPLGARQRWTTTTATPPREVFHAQLTTLLHPGQPGHAWAPGFIMQAPAKCLCVTLRVCLSQTYMGQANKLWSTQYLS